MLLEIIAAWQIGQPIAEPRIVWRAPAECPSEAEVRAWTMDLLPRGASDGVPIAAEASIDVEHDGGYRLALTIDAPQGRDERLLRDRSCETLARASAVVIAVAVDPLAVIAEMDVMDRGDAIAPAPDPVEDDALADVVATSQAPSPPSPSPRAPRSIQWQAAMRVHGIAGFGVLPRGDFGFGLALAAVRPYARIELQLLHAVRGSARYAALEDVGADLRLWAASVRGCGVPSVRTLEVVLCAGIEAGAVTGRGAGVEIRNDAAAPWAAVVVGPALVWRPLAQLGVWAGVDGLVALTRPGFFIRDVGPEVYRVRSAAVRGAVGIEVRVP